MLVLFSLDVLGQKHQDKTSRQNKTSLVGGCASVCGVCGAVCGHTYLRKSKHRNSIVNDGLGAPTAREAARA